jgi:hypothetical protein
MADDGDGSYLNRDAQGMDDAPATEARYTFHLEEYKSLRDEILKRSTDQRVNERFVYVANAASYAFLINLFKETAPNIRSLSFIGWWIPFMISCAGFFKWRSETKSIENIARYIQFLEQYFGPVNLGWETHLAGKTDSKGSLWKKRSPILYGVLIILGFSAAAWQTFLFFFKR